MRLIFLLFLTLSRFICAAHPLHLTITNIDITDTTLSINIQVSTHELIHALNHKNHEYKDTSYYLLEQTGIKITDTYIKSKIKIRLNERQIPLKNIQLEIHEENTHITYKTALSEQSKSIQVENTLFLEVSHEQKNLLIIKHNNFEKGFELNTTKWTEKLKF